MQKFVGRRGNEVKYQYAESLADLALNSCNSYQYISNSNKDDARKYDGEGVYSQDGYPKYLLGEHVFVDGDGFAWMDEETDKEMKRAEWDLLRDWVIAARRLKTSNNK